MRQPGPLDELVLDLVATIPRGELTTYTELASLAGELGIPTTARRVARTLALYGSDVPWWRVVQAGGTVAEKVLEEAAPRLAAEGVLVSGRRVRISGSRWDPDPEQLRSQIGLGIHGPRMRP